MYLAQTRVDIKLQPFSQPCRFATFINPHPPRPLRSLPLACVHAMAGHAAACSKRHNAWPPPTPRSPLRARALRHCARLLATKHTIHAAQHKLCPVACVQTGGAVQQHVQRALHRCQVLMKEIVPQTHRHIHVQAPRRGHTCLDMEKPTQASSHCGHAFIRLDSQIVDSMEAAQGLIENAMRLRTDSVQFGLASSNHHPTNSNHHPTKPAAWPQGYSHPAAA